MTPAKPQTWQLTRSNLNQIDAAIDDVFARWQAGLGDQRPQDAIRDAVLAVLSTLADRAAGLREAADECDQRATAIDALSSSDFDEEARVVRELAAIASKIRCMADEAQQPEEAWPSESQWRVEIYDPGVEQWVPFGTLTTKPEAERRLALAAERAPRWRDDGTDVRRRIVRTDVTYTVEAEAQR